MKVGIIGCGLIGGKRAATGLEVVAAADVVFERAVELTGRHGGKPCRDWRGVLDSPADIVVVATSHDQLAGIGLEVLKAGKHLLLEKPGARNAAELEPLAALAAESGLRVKVGYNHRFHPAMLKAKELIEAGALGDMLFLRGRYGHGGRPGYEKEWRFRPEISGGGELIDQGSHLIDLSRWFLGGEIAESFGVLARYFWDSPVEDNCFLTLRTAAGQTAQLHATWTEWKNMFSLEVYGRDGKLAIDGLGGSYGVEQLAFYRMLPEMGPPETVIWQYPHPDQSWRREMEELVAAIREDRQPIGNIDDALAVLRVMGDIYAKSSLE